MFIATVISQLLGLLNRHAGNTLNLGEYLDKIKKVHPRIHMVECYIAVKIYKHGIFELI